MSPRNEYRQSGMTRKKFLTIAGFFPIVASSPTAGEPQKGAAVKSSRTPGSVSTFRNRAFELNLSLRPELWVTLKQLSTGLLLANGPYNYSFGAPNFKEMVVSRRGAHDLIVLEGSRGNGLDVRHEFVVATDSDWLEEQITLTNRSSQVLALPDARSGFVLPVEIENGSVKGPLKELRLTAVPFRREPTGNRQQYADYSILDVLTKPRRSTLRAKAPTSRWGNVVLADVHATGFVDTTYAQYASEGWVLTNGRQGVVISKYSPTGMEWSVLDRVLLESNLAGLRWGGLAVFEGDPEQGAYLRDRHEFGVTRISSYEGGLEEGFYTFRREMEARGHGCPAAFDPPVHWNELYDNKLWWLNNQMKSQDEPENRAQYYRLDDMKQEAAKARDIGCEALYLDPGWDTNFASKIWDESRLGAMESFVKMLRGEFGLKLSLHTPLSGWCNPSSYSRTIDRLGPDGKRVEFSLCGASRQYVEETYRRLERLADAGASYFMFDGTMFNGECWDAEHGHSIPSTREEHVEATNRLARLVHARHADLLIEMHDQILGGTTLRHVPIYYGHGMPSSASAVPQAKGFDCVWAFELMWDPMTDLVGGHSIALYYYNLAYSLPLYIHIDLRKDNEQALMFWWNASTCRYLGIGGTHQSPAVRQKHHDSMAVYRRLKPFFARGTFYGGDELTHIHVHPSEHAAVVNCFNLDPGEVTRSIAFHPARFKLPNRTDYRVVGAEARQEAGDYQISVTIPGYGHTLFEIRPAGQRTGRG